jgi:ATP-binding cassette subfamily B protein
VFLASVAPVTVLCMAATDHAARAYQSLLLFGHYQEITVGEAPAAGGAAAPALAKGIEFREVWFRYADDLPWVLNGVSFTLPAGGCVGMVGANGAGKSTIVKLLCRMYEPQRGEIRWDGVELRDIEPASLRRRISAVFQDFMAYDFTAADNIGIGRLESLGDRDRIRAAAVLAEVDETIEGLPKGYDTLLSRIFPDDEDGRTITLSGGQWQRIAVARAFLRDDIDLLILDEASSGLDAQAEYVLQQRLARLRRGRSSLLVTHRLNSMRAADLILVIDGGRVVESGTHDGLIARGDRYARLFRMQSEGYQMSGASPRPLEGA